MLRAAALSSCIVLALMATRPAEAQLRVRSIATMRVRSSLLKVEATSDGAVRIIGSDGSDSILVAADADELQLWTDTVSALLAAELPTTKPGERVEYNSPVLEGQHRARMQLWRSADGASTTTRLLLWGGYAGAGIRIRPNTDQAQQFIRVLGRAASTARELKGARFIGATCKPSGAFDKVNVTAVDSFPHPAYLRNLQKQLSARFHPDNEFTRSAAEVILRIYSDGSASDSLAVGTGEYNFDEVAIRNALERAEYGNAYGPLPSISGLQSVRFAVVFGCRSNLRQ